MSLNAFDCHPNYPFYHSYVFYILGWRLATVYGLRSGRISNPDFAWSKSENFTVRRKATPTLVGRSLEPEHYCDVMTLWCRFITSRSSFLVSIGLHLILCFSSSPSLAPPHSSHLSPSLPSSLPSSCPCFPSSFHSYVFSLSAGLSVTQQ